MWPQRNQRAAYWRPEGTLSVAYTWASRYLLGRLCVLDQSTVSGEQAPWGAVEIRGPVRRWPGRPKRHSIIEASWHSGDA